MLVRCSRENYREKMFFFFSSRRRHTRSSRDRRSDVCSSDLVKLGEMANMVSESWDGKRIYATNSLLSQWDKPGDYWLKAYAWEGGKLVPKFTTDFTAVGRAHIMNFGTAAPIVARGAHHIAQRAR